MCNGHQDGHLLLRVLIIKQYFSGKWSVNVNVHGPGYIFLIFLYNTMSELHSVYVSTFSILHNDVNFCTTDGQ